jgi:TonB family protein
VTPAALARDLTAFSIQLALVAIAVAVLMTLVRVPARVRYVCLRLALVAGLVLPWLLRGDPPPVVVTTATPTTVVDSVAVTSTPWPVTAPKAAAETIARFALAIPWTHVIVGVLLTGIVLRTLWLAIGLLRLRAMSNRATECDLPEYADLQQRLGTAARIAQVEGLAQPATFGVRRPVVLLPDQLAGAPSALHRAVVTHELFHVRRRDWLAVLGEEIVRTVFWFHPAVFWLTSSIQLAREEIVDELSVRLTGDRRAYMQALLVFADTAGPHAAPAFAHRRQLFRRIVSVSKEKAMSAPRLVTSTAVLLAAVFATSWYASSFFPIVSAARADVSPLTIAAPAAPRLPGSGRLDAPAAAAVQGSATAEPQSPRPVTPENPIPRRTRGVAPVWPSQFERGQVGAVVSALVTLDREGRVVGVDRSGCSATQRDNETAVCVAFFEATAAAIRRWRYAPPAQAPIQFTVIASYRPGAEPVITQAGSDVLHSEWLAYVRETQDRLRVVAENTAGVGAVRPPTATAEEFLNRQMAELTNKLREVERAQRLAMERYNANHPDVLGFQRQYAQLAVDLERVQEQLARARVAEAAVRDSADKRREDEETLRAQLRDAEAAFQEARRAQERATATRVEADRAGLPMVAPSGKAPVRVIGTIRVLEQTKPAYTAEAMAARVEGTVVLEVLIDERGHVPDARIVRSIPLLDRSALEAVKQWRFAPTTINGEPVPVMAQVEMSFTLK